MISAADDGRREGSHARWAGKGQVSGTLVIVAAWAIALYLWLPGYNGRPLWVDELWRADLILQPDLYARYLFHPDLYTAITAPVYVLMNRSIALFFVSAESLRLSSLIPGLLSIAVAYRIATKAGGGVLLGLLAAGLIATDFEFAQYANQLKPYMLEVLIHLLCMLAWLNILGHEQRSPWHFAAFVAVVSFALFSAANVVFILPALGASVLADSWRRPGKEGLVGALVTFGVLGLLTAVLYLRVWSYGSDKNLLAYWAHGFYGAGDPSYLEFLRRRFDELWTGAFNLPGGFGETEARNAWWIATAAVVSLLFRWAWTRRVPGIMNAATFYFVFALTAAALNFLDLWPLGQLRPNLFLYAHLQVLLVLLLAAFSVPRLQSALAIVLVFVPLKSVATADRASLKTYGAPVERNDLVARDFADDGVIGKTIAQTCATRPTTLLINGYMEMAFEFYSTYATGWRDDFGVFLGPCVHKVVLPDASVNPNGLMQLLSTHIVSGVPTWLLYSHQYQGDVRDLKARAAQFGRIDQEQAFVGAGYFKITGKPSENEDK